MKVSNDSEISFSIIDDL